MKYTLLALSFLLAFGAPAEAQYDFGSIWWDAECSPGAPTVITARIEIGQDFAGRVHEIRVKRSTVGQCESTVVVESREFDALGPGEYDYEFVDPEPVSGLPFRYNVTLHDETGEDLRVSNYFVVGTMVDIVACGPTLVGHGYVRSRDSSGGAGAPRSDQDSPYLEVCPGACWDGFYVANRNDLIMQALLDTDVPALLFGEIECTGIYGCYITITEALAQACEGVTPTETRSWGSLKARF